MFYVRAFIVLSNTLVLIERLYKTRKAMDEKDLCKELYEILWCIVFLFCLTWLSLWR